MIKCYDDTQLHFISERLGTMNDEGVFSVNVLLGYVCIVGELVGGCQALERDIVCL